MGLAVQDQSSEVKVTRALPGSATTVSSDGINLKNGTSGDFMAQCELQIEAPATGTGLADAGLMTYDVYHDTAVGFGSETLLMDNVITQTGAGGAGAAAQTVRVRLPVDVKQYIRVKVTKTGTGDASAAIATIRLVF